MPSSAAPELTEASSALAWTPARRAAFLSTTRLFAQLSPPVMAAVAAQCHATLVASGGYVFSEGQPTDSLCVLAAGRVKIVRETENGHEVILRLIAPGEMFGGARIWEEASYLASARAQEPVAVLQLPTEAVQSLLATQPEFALALVRELGQRLREAEARLRDLQTERVERRVARALLRLAGKNASDSSAPASGGGKAKAAAGRTGRRLELPKPLTRQDLAELSGTTLHTASRVVSRWHQRGVIEAHRAHIVILRPGVLADIAAEEQPNLGGG
jgi:CRP-like cAMP-binding protein